MKKIILILLLLFSISSYAQWDFTANQVDGKYSQFTNTNSIFGISASGIKGNLLYNVTNIDTSIWLPIRSSVDGKYSQVINKKSYLGHDSGTIRLQLIYDVNAFNPSQPHTWAGMQTFDSVQVNNYLVAPNVLNPLDFLGGKIIVEKDSAFVPMSKNDFVDSAEVDYFNTKKLSVNYAKMIGQIQLNQIYGHVNDWLYSGSHIDLWGDDIQFYGNDTAKILTIEPNQITFASSFIPDSTSKRDIGSASKLIKRIYADSISTNVGIFQKIAVGTASNFISQLAVGQDTNSINLNGVFNFVNSTFNKNRSTLSEATDTSSFNLAFTKSGKPQLRITGIDGTRYFEIDTVGSLRLRNQAGTYNNVLTSNSITMSGQTQIDPGGIRVGVMGTLDGIGITATTLLRYGTTPALFGITDKYQSATDLRYLKFGYSSDSIAYLSQVNLGRYTARPFRINVSAFDTAPSSAGDTGTAGEIRFCSDAIYICTATNTWKKAAIGTW